ncbi:ATP-dependent DNA ligase [Nocardioides marmoraquaticus]
MLLARLVEVSGQVAATSKRLEKRELIADLLREAAPGGADTLDLAATYLSGTLRQRRTGLGWRTLSDLPPPATEPSLTLDELDRTLDRVSTLSGSGSGTARRDAAADLFGRLTAPEQDWLRAVLTGNVRQGALDSVMLDAVARAAEVPLAEVRRAAMFSAPTGPIAAAALTRGVEALGEFSMVVTRPVRPMLAGTAPDVAAGLDKVAPDDAVAVDTKLDGIRVQVHKRGDDVIVFTRSLDDITERLPEVVEVVRGLPARDLVLDGEALAIGPDGRPRPFQETASTTATHAGAAGVAPYFFDLLLHDDDSLVEVPTRERLARLDAVVPEEHRVARLVTGSADEAQAFFDDVVARGHEGVIVKRLDAPYDAGRRGSAWVKVKPRHTLDLVVLGVEWGSGRRRGYLSNIHLGARTDDGFVMLGKTFKGMTDEILAWQTERFLALETARKGHVVHVRPEQVVEIAFDGVQRSTRYPGGVALRFARVLRYRDDKPPSEADTLATVRSHLP